MKMETNNCPRRVQLRVGKNFTGVRHPSTFGLGHKYRRSVRPVRARELPQLALVLRPMRAKARREPATSLSRSGLHRPSAV